jgi:hypothetical protein
LKRLRKKKNVKDALDAITKKAGTVACRFIDKNSTEMDCERYLNQWRELKVNLLRKHPIPSSSQQDLSFTFLKKLFSTYTKERDLQGKDA